MNDKEKIAMLVGFLNGMFVRGENFTVVSKKTVETFLAKICQDEKPNASVLTDNQRNLVESIVLG